MTKLDQVIPIDRVWAIDPDRASFYCDQLASIDVIAGLQAQREHEERLAAIATKEAAARKERGEPEPKPYETHGRTAVLIISGPMTKKPTSASYITGGTATIMVRSLLRAAMSDDDIDNVMLKFEDCPGGQASGTAELGDDIREMGQIKPIVAYIEDLGASAAYWAASQCSAIYANKSAEIGSVGVYAAVIDSSQAATQAGLKVHLIKTGKYKGAGYPGTEITESQLEDWQDLVNATFTDFKAAVQTGRQMADDEVDAIADGRVFKADKALSLKLIDGICSYEQCLDSMSAIADTTTATNVAHAPAKASKPAAKEKPMSKTQTRVDRFLAALGLKSEAIHESGVTEEALQEALDQELKATGNETATSLSEFEAKLAKIQADAEAALKFAKESTAALAISAANSFAEQMKRDCRIQPANEAETAGVFLDALRLDGGGEPQVKDGKLVEGESVARVRKAFGNLRQHKDFKQEIPDAGKSDDASEAQQARVKDLKDRVLAGTATGRKILKEKEAK